MLLISKSLSRYGYNLSNDLECFQVQERLTKEIALAVDDAICPNGVAVVVEASHMCMVNFILISLIIIIVYHLIINN